MGTEVVRFVNFFDGAENRNIVLGKARYYHGCFKD